MLERLVVIIIGQSLKTLLVLFFALFLFYHLFGKRLEETSAYLRNINENNLGSRLSFSHRKRHWIGEQPDELDHLALTLNSTSERLQHTVIDLTENVQKLKESEEKFKVLVENVPDAVFIINVATSRIIECNKNTEDGFHGLKRNCEAILVRFPSTPSEALIQASLLDITERKKAENARSLFFASLSHELRTPLNAIIGFSDLLSLDSTLHPQQHDLVKTIKVSGDHLLQLIENILLFSKNERTGVTLQLSHFWWSDLMHEVKAIISPLVGNGVKFECLLEGGDFEVKADKQMMRQVFLNILSNATKFTEKGQIEFRSTCSQTTTDSVNIVTTISDTGSGMSADVVNHLFIPFSSVSPPLTARVSRLRSGIGNHKTVPHRDGWTN